MIRHVRFDKKQRIVTELVRRIETGQLGNGSLLPGEHQLADEFAVSRGTLREALAELKRRNYIATQGGVGSIVTYDGLPLDQRVGWARALAESGVVIRTEPVRLERVQRPDLADRFGITEFVVVERRRIADTGIAVSLEHALLPACEGLERLPDTGLLNDSLTVSLTAYGFIGAYGEQWLGSRALDDREAALLARPSGSVFLSATRITYDARHRFMECVDSLLDPAHFRLHLTFGNPS